MQFPPPAARSVDVIFRWRQRACKISKRKTVTTNTQPRFYMKLPIECGDRQCMMYKREQTIKQNPEKEKGSVCGMLAGRGKRPARPITACTILILRNSHEYASEKTKRRFNFFRGFYFFSHLLASKICHYKTGVLSFEPSF